ncbi:putative adenylyltransferase/sulfurtransferase MoeZ [Rosistilla carotiformis]|uniref:Putative adenylyltransferase/sulfurtransferase MoeZ n=1 Tax=Rosistilla carotiformis TaxID=2528017 RepID=A0A518JSH0_9BACT|nr:ThiF family adenylyltransferase [Rosistilla carotiformis]QDV68492.1 putative adenylyltransferase/sulfurtransferase MoeZ [Rosistilla carotiformis]
MTRSNRYARQVQFPPIGATGQSKLAAARVLVLGVGALGTVAAELLARAGVGMLRLVDRDTVEWSNLQRQSLFEESDAESQVAKAAAAAEKLQRINSEIEIQAEACDVHPGNILNLMSDISLVVDATDNFPTRLLLNDASVELGKPWVHGGCVGAQGQVGFFNGIDRPCFRCVVPELPDAGTVQTCDTAGVLNAATHTIASLQVSQAIQWIVSGRAALQGKLQTIDLWSARFLQIEIAKLAQSPCPLCQERSFDFLHGEIASQPIVLCGRNAVQIPATGGVSIDKIADNWRGIGEVQQTRFLLRLRIDPFEITLFADGRAIVSGTEEIAKARSLYAQYVGQ